MTFLGGIFKGLSSETYMIMCLLSLCFKASRYFKLFLNLPADFHAFNIFERIHIFHYEIICLY